MESRSNQLELFTADSLDLASPSPWLVSRKDGTTIDTYGLNFCGWSEKLGRFGWLLRTYLESCTLPLTTFARTWSVSATKSGFGILKLRLSERSTGGRESRLWATPTAADSEGTGTTKDRSGSGGGCRTLRNDVKLFPTPRAAHGMGSQPRDPENIVNPNGRLEDHVALYPTPRPCSGDRSSGANRTEFYEAFRMFPTPRASDGEKGGPNQKYTNGSPTLAAVAAMFPTPNTVDAKGGTRIGDGQEQLCHVAGGSLNPAWVEWLMGFPPNWTDLEHDEVPTDLDGLEEWWRSEPAGLPRVAHGVKDRVARLKALGNAVDPRWARGIFRAIKCMESGCRDFPDGREEGITR